MRSVQPATASVQPRLAYLSLVRERYLMEAVSARESGWGLPTLKEHKQVANRLDDETERGEVEHVLTRWRSGGGDRRPVIAHAEPVTVQTLRYVLVSNQAAQGSRHGSRGGQ